MMLRRWLVRLNREERGFAMITAVILLGVIGTLSALVMSAGTHSDFASGRGRSWVQALHVAESGVERAIAKLQETSATYTGSFTGTVSEGNYSVTVTRVSRNKVRIESSGAVGGTGPGLSATRRLRVTMGPPPNFKYALFSYTSIDTKNNDAIVGDLWANKNVIVDANDVITGSVTAANGYIRLRNRSRVTGDLVSGLFDEAESASILLEELAIVEGNAKASVTAPTDPVTCGGETTGNYDVRLQSGSRIDGNVTTWGTRTGPGTVGGTVSNNACTAAPAVKDLPVFTFSPENYDAATLRQFGTATTPSAAAVSEFHAHVAASGKRIQGTYFINQANPVSQAVRVDLTGVTITGDTTIITNTPVFSNGVDSNATGAIFVLVSTYSPPAGTSCDLNQDNSECSVHLKNNFQPSTNTAVLVYSPYGPVAIKNNQDYFGSIYSDDIIIKNNQTLTYDARVERVVGFGDATYVVEQWLELNP